jgi:hypothetical protein
MKFLTEVGGGNVLRDTPGRLLMGWALLFSAVVLLSWRVQVHRAEWEWLEYPTGLGDGVWYDAGAGLRGVAVEDFYAANLVFTWEGRRYELFRRLHEPTRRKDARMVKVGRDQESGLVVYREEKRVEPVRFFLKAGDGLYLEFGERLYYQRYEQVKGDGVSN